MAIGPAHAGENQFTQSREAAAEAAGQPSTLYKRLGPPPYAPQDRTREFVDGRETKDHISAVLNERGARYGDFTHHAAVCQDLKDRMMFHKYSRYERLNNVQKQALDVIADKIARILTGDPNYADNWVDIQGYARLVEERLPCVTGTPATQAMAAQQNTAR